MKNTSGLNERKRDTNPTRKALSAASIRKRRSEKMPLFVYGLLREGQPMRKKYAHLIARAEPAEMYGDLYLGEFPFMILDDGSTNPNIVKGEVLWFRDEDEAFEILDDEEEGYKRVMETTVGNARRGLTDGSIRVCVYVFKRWPLPGEERIESGDWLEYVNAKKNH